MGNGTEEVADGGEEAMSSNDDWVVECSDEETYDPAGCGGGVWQPKVEDIAGLYERLAAGQELQLEWLCPGRRSPSPDQPHHDADAHKDEPVQQKQVERELPKGFDFDEDMDGGGMKPGFTPRRTPGSGTTPRSQKKRVASMDNIMRDIMRHKKMEAAERKNTPGRRLLASPGQRRGPLNPAQRRLLNKPVDTHATTNPPATTAHSTVTTPASTAPLMTAADPFSMSDMGGGAPDAQYHLPPTFTPAPPPAEVDVGSTTLPPAIEAAVPPPVVDPQPPTHSEGLPGQDAPPQPEVQPVVADPPSDPTFPSTSDISSAIQTMSVSEPAVLSHVPESDRKDAQLVDNAGGGVGEAAQPEPGHDVAGHMDTAVAVDIQPCPAVVQPTVPASPVTQTTEPEPAQPQPMPEPMATEEVTSTPAPVQQT